MKLNTIQHPKLLRLRRRLAVPTWGAVGVLESLWHLTAQHAKDGAIGRTFSNEDIANSIGWDGDPDQFVAALVDSGWLDRCDLNRLVVHDWADHCPDFVRGNLGRTRSSFAVPAKTDPLPTPVANTSTQQVYGTPVGNASTDHQMPTPRPSQSKPIQSKPIQADEEGGVEPTEAVDPPPDAKAEVRCQGARKVWHLTASQIADWQATYPGLDVEGECRKALAWLQATPSRKRTASGMPRFLVNWLNRATERPPATQARTVYPPKAATPTVSERMGNLATLFTPQAPAPDRVIALEVKPHG